MTKHLFLASLLLGMLLLSFSCKKELSTTGLGQVQSIDLSETTKETAFQLIQNTLTAQYKLLASKNAIENMNILKSLKLNFSLETDAKNIYDAVLQEKIRLSADDLLYHDPKVLIDKKDLVFAIDGDTLLVNVVATYVLPTNAIDDETNSIIISEGVYHYNFAIIKKGDQLVVQREIKIDDFPPIEPSEDVSERESFTTGLNAKTSSAYDAKAAVKYALKYYKNPNSSYYDYSSSGGDCTNFLSQCLNEGGWIQINKWHWLSNGTSCDNNMVSCKRSPSWSGAYKFYEFITNSGSDRVSRKFANLQVCLSNSSSATKKDFRHKSSVLKKGDIVQMSSTTNGSSVYHSTIVTSRDGVAQKIFVTYRNAAGYPVAKDKYVGDLGSGRYLQGFAVKGIGN